MKKLISLLLTTTMLFAMTACSKAEASWQEKYDAGLRYLNDLDYESAIQSFNEAIEIDPEQQAAYESLIEAQTAMDNANRPVAEETEEQESELLISVGPVVEPDIAIVGPDAVPYEIEFIPDEDTDNTDQPSQPAGETENTTPTTPTESADTTAESTETTETEDSTATETEEPEISIGEPGFVPGAIVVGPGSYGNEELFTVLSSDESSSTAE